MRRVSMSCRSSGRSAMIASNDQQAKHGRAIGQDFEDAQRRPTGSRIATAMTENDRSVPVIQITTMTSCGRCH